MIEGFVHAADGSRLYFQQHGESPDVLLVPNGVVYARDWQPLVAKRTVIFYDLRNRGRSDTVHDVTMLRAGIHNDIADLDAVRQHFGVQKVSLLAHSYPALMVLLYAAKYSARVTCVIGVGVPPPCATTEYPPELSWRDAVYAEVMASLAVLQQSPPAADPEERCRAFWSMLRPLFVADPAHAMKINWGRCELANERAAFGYLNRFVFPSIAALSPQAADFRELTAPVLLFHGRRDRSAPLGGAVDWVALLRNARLVTVDTGHAPWIERPAEFFHDVETFLNHQWPEWRSSHGGYA
jgi:pimeloyl-ACP methyl ester carboxylesterase